MPTRSERWALALPACLATLTGLGLFLAGCGGGDSTPAAPPPPPPPQPLTWNNVPEGITVQVGETETFTATLSAAIDATYTISADSEAVEVSGEPLRAGVFQGMVTGVEAGEVQISIQASQTGFVTATTSFDVVVEDPFDLSLWRELVFDAFDCPSGFMDERCQGIWGERDVEDRITAILPFQPNFHLVTRFRDARFTASHRETMRKAIHDSVEQITGDIFTGEITSGNGFRDMNQWVDVVPVGRDFFDGRGVCGAAGVGQTNGIMIVNVDNLDNCDLFAVTMHEVGHALGFFHVLDLGDYIMSPRLTEIPPVFSETEQFHAQLGWELGRGMPYTPDPRKASSTLLTTEASRGARTLDNLSLEDMVVCPLH